MLRRWDGPILLAEASTVGIEVDGGSDRLRAETGSEITMLELDAPAAAAARRDRSEPMTVLGSFAPLAGPATLADFLVGGQVLDTNPFEARRCPSEQTALSLYRIARHRGGPFWTGVAEVIAEWVAARLTTGALPVHGLWGKAETHTRFLADGVLLLLAHAERSGSPWDEAARRAHTLIDRLTVESEVGSWVVHDSLELERGEVQLVFNTHAQTTAVALAAGRDASGLLAAADRVLDLRPRLGRGAVLAAASLLGDVGRGAGGPIARWGRRLGARARAASAHHQQANPYLALPSGWLERDVSPAPSPVQYHVVNTHDLAVLVAVTGSSSLARHLSRPLAYTRWVAARADLREGVETVVLVPSLFRMLGRHQLARRASARLAASGMVPTIGWPSRTDHLVRRLPQGTP